MAQRQMEFSKDRLSAAAPKKTLGKSWAATTILLAHCSAALLAGCCSYRTGARTEPEDGYILFVLRGRTQDRYSSRYGKYQQTQMTLGSCEGHLTRSL